MIKVINKYRGFTLIELMVASGILVILLAAFLTTFNGILKTANYSQGLSLAYSACLSELEEMINHDFSSLKTDYSTAWTSSGWTFVPSGWTSVPSGINGMGNIRITDRSELYRGGEWTVATSASWTVRTNPISLVYDNKMWIMGGFNGGYPDDAWYSTNGINWTLATHANCLARSGHRALVYGNKMWVMGGSSGSPLNNVWYSADGVNWIIATNTAWATGGRVNHAALVYDNKMWVIGGSPGSNEVWYSTNGANWTLATNTPGWSKSNHAALVYDNKMWVIGGGLGQDIWYSTNGIDWKLATNNPAWSDRVSPGYLVYDNRMWIIGGLSSGSYKNDVWNSYGYDRLLEVIITVCWRQSDGRLFGEDANLNGVLDTGEDTLTVNNRLDSPAQLRILLSEKNILNLRKTFLGRQ